ncbi:glutamine--fructose-6-phosphate transaminase (isomerizing) [Glycocaulis profundi]|nr:glutamine--fructose-6-phosphate transaminase (isomerizing) [Glycocaulis profundi]
MCGIVGVAGSGRAQDVILEGLRRLEYRGYDSAGLAVMGADGAVTRVRAAGKVAELERRLDGRLEGGTGIGHTRWATHGEANDANAHPHRAGRVHLVHNGIIENFKALKAEIAAAGRSFTSDTDTEAVAHLLDMAVEDGLAPREAMLHVLGRLEGAFALAAVFDGEEQLVVGARRGAPLIAALGDEEGFLASDLMALAGRARRVAYLEEGDMAVVRPGSIEIHDRTGARVERPLAIAEASAALAEKGNHRHFMIKEIYEQPEVVGRTLAHYLDAVEGRVRPAEGVDFTTARRLLIVGCGTAAYAGQVARYWFEEVAGLPVQVDIASEFRYREPAFMDGDMALFISQSGETADTLEALRLCRRAGVETIALVNTPHSTMAREAGQVAPTLAGPEIGVASTKAFTCQLAALASLAVMAGRQRGRLEDAAETAHVEALMAAPGLMTRALDAEARIETLAHELTGASLVLYLGRNQFYPLALEAALKLKEISYLHAEGYAAGELKHGPIALVEDGVPVIVIAPMDPLFDKTRSSIEQVQSRGASVICITDPEGAAALEGEPARVIALPAAGRLGAPLVGAVAIQLLAYHVAVHKGTDVDQPRNLAKSVTVE